MLSDAVLHRRIILMGINAKVMNTRFYCKLFCIIKKHAGKSSSLTGRKNGCTMDHTIWFIIQPSAINFLIIDIVRKKDCGITDNTISIT